MSEQANEYGPVATRMIFDNDDVRVWEMTSRPVRLRPASSYDGLRALHPVGRERRRAVARRRKMMPFPSRRAPRILFRRRIESAHNMGDTRFFEALFELKRPAKPGREKLGFVGCEASRQGARARHITILDNARVRVSEITLAPGGQSGVRRWSHDTAVYVAEGGPVKIVGAAGDGDERSREESFPAGRVLWFAKGTNCGVVNVGTQRYRQVAVELK